MLAGLLDLICDEHERVRDRLLDLVPGGSGAVYGDWFTSRGAAFRGEVQVATLDPFRGYKNAVDQHLADAVAVLVVVAFHVVRRGTGCLDDVRRRVQQPTLKHRGRKGDPLYGVRTILRAGAENLTDRQRSRLDRAFTAHEDQVQVQPAWRVAQDVRALFHTPDPANGRAGAQRVLDILPTCPVPEIKCLGRTAEPAGRTPPGALRHRRPVQQLDEAVNGFIELHRRIT